MTIREVAPTRVAVFEHRGDPETIDITIQRFVAWRKAAGLSPQSNPTFNIWYSVRRPAGPADYRMDLCVSVGADHPIDDSGGTVKAGEIPAGRCAVLRVRADSERWTTTELRD